MPEPFVWPVRVYYEDTDAGGVVYYANYLKFAERARTEWLRSLGINQDTLWSEYGLGFIVRRCDVDYRAPARLDDALEVSCEIEESGRSKLIIRQEVRRSGDVLALLCVTVVCVNEQLRPVRLPAFINGPG